MKNNTITYKIEFADYWHIGSGLSGGADVDALVLKDNNGFPFIPGKTLKGLIREQALLLAKLPSSDITTEWMNAYFGMEVEKNQQNVERKPGRLYFSNAYLSKNVQDTLVKPLNNYLFSKIASTRINDMGIAEKGSLRKSEVSLPVTLFAQIIGVEDVDAQRIEQCLKMIKRMGVSRNRGLGRCELSIQKVEEAK